MKKVKIIILVILIIEYMLISSSCNYAEINDMPMISGLAIDKEEDKYYLTASVIVPTASSKEGGKTQQIFVQSSGNTIFDAIRDFILKDGKKVFWGHLQFMIVNKEIAKEDISQVLDLAIRDDELREDIWVLVTGQDYNAEELLTIGLSNEKYVGYIESALANVDANSKYSPVEICDLVGFLNSSGIDALIPIIYIENILDESRVVISGGAIFKDEKMIGEIDEKDVKVYRIVTNKEKGGIHVIEYTNINEESSVSIEVKKTKTDVNVNKDQSGNISIDLDITISGIIAEIVNNKVDLLDKINIEEFKKQAEEQLKKQIEQSITKIQKEYGSDIYGFGERVKRKYPSDYKLIENEWENIFSSMKINVSVEVDISGSALCADPLNKNK